MLLHYVQALVLAAFTAVMAAAAFEDFRRFVIPNLLPIALCALWPIYFAASPSVEGAVSAVACAVAVFLVGAVLFARGMIGGGDVKLLSAATLWAGPAGTPALLMLTSVIGGGLTLFLLMPFGRRLAAAIRGRLGNPSSPAEGGLVTRVPYGIAIAGAALIVTIPHFFG